MSPSLSLTAPAAPGNVRITSSTFSSISLVWDTPDPLNGNFAAYELRFGDETTFGTDVQERLLFTTQSRLTGLSVGVIYLVEVRAGTVSLIGEILWGPFVALRVLNGECVFMTSLYHPCSCMHCRYGN